MVIGRSKVVEGAALERKICAAVETMTNISEAFSLLHDLVDMSKRQRAEMFNSVNSKLLKLLATDLFDSKKNSDINDKLDFCDLAEQLSNREAYWSRQLGRSILRSSELEKAGEVNKAEDIMIQFISRCSSVSYCEIARAHLQATKDSRYPGNM